MSVEIELKFIIGNHSDQQIEEKLSELFHKYTVLEQSEYSLSNHYFDSDDLILQRQRYGLRIRQNNTRYELTMKSPGTTVGGLHQHPEFNLSLDSYQLDFDSIPKAFLTPAISEHYQTSDFKHQFSTNFLRQQTLLQIAEGEVIEIAFDCGEISLPATHVDENETAGLSEGPFERVFEIELELKSGSIASLFTFAHDLIQIGELRLGVLSKAARGYRLAFPDKVEEHHLVYTRASHLTDSANRLFYELIEHIMTHWKNCEELYIEKQTEAILQQMLDYLEELKTVFLLYQQSFHELPFYERLDQLILTLLNCIHHSADKTDGDLARSLFYSAEYNRLLLDLNQWIQEQKNK